MNNEEAKQRAKNYMSLKGALEPKQIKCYCGHTIMCDCSPIDEPKQETLEEVAENYGNSIGNKNGTAQFDFIRGAKWQQERMYSEGEVLDIIDSLFHCYASSYRVDAKEKFLQYKNIL